MYSTESRQLNRAARCSPRGTYFFSPCIARANPPYGERLLDRKQAEDLYRGFGSALSGLQNWSVYLLSSHPEFERCFGRQADKKRKLYNGMIKCDLFMYFK